MAGQHLTCSSRLLCVSQPQVRSKYNGCHVELLERRTACLAACGCQVGFLTDGLEIYLVVIEAFVEPVEMKRRSGRCRCVVE